MLSTSPERRYSPAWATRAGGHGVQRGHLGVRGASPPSAISAMPCSRQRCARRSTPPGQPRRPPSTRMTTTRAPSARGRGTDPDRACPAGSRSGPPGTRRAAGAPPPRSRGSRCRRCDQPQQVAAPAAGREGRSGRPRSMSAVSRSVSRCARSGRRGASSWRSRSAAKLILAGTNGSPRRAATQRSSARRASSCSSRPCQEVPSVPCDAQPSSSLDERRAAVPRRTAVADLVAAHVAAQQRAVAADVGAGPSPARRSLRRAAARGLDRRRARTPRRR